MRNVSKWGQEGRGPWWRTQDYMMRPTAAGRRGVGSGLPGAAAAATVNLMFHPEGWAKPAWELGPAWAQTGDMWVGG